MSLGNCLQFSLKTLVCVLVLYDSKRQSKSPAKCREWPDSGDEANVYLCNGKKCCGQKPEAKGRSRYFAHMI